MPPKFDPNEIKVKFVSNFNNIKFTQNLDFSQFCKWPIMLLLLNDDVICAWYHMISTYA